MFISWWCVTNILLYSDADQCAFIVFTINVFLWCITVIFSRKTDQFTTVHQHLLILSNVVSFLLITALPAFITVKSSENNVLRYLKHLCVDFNHCCLITVNIGRATTWQNLYERARHYCLLFFFLNKTDKQKK